MNSNQNKAEMTAKQADLFVEYLGYYLESEAEYKFAREKFHAQETLLATTERLCNKTNQSEVREMLSRKLRTLEEYSEHERKAMEERHNELKRHAGKLAAHMRGIQASGVAIDQSFLYELEHV